MEPKMRSKCCRIVEWIALVLLVAPVATAGQPKWVAAMREVPTDIDRQRRSKSPDLGADER